MFNLLKPFMMGNLTRRIEAGVEKAVIQLIDGLEQTLHTWLFGLPLGMDTKQTVARYVDRFTPIVGSRYTVHDKKRRRGAHQHSPLGQQPGAQLAAQSAAQPIPQTPQGTAVLPLVAVVPAPPPQRLSERPSPRRAPAAASLRKVAEPALQPQTPASPITPSALNEALQTQKAKSPFVERTTTTTTRYLDRPELEPSVQTLITREAAPA